MVLHIVVSKCTEFTVSNLPACSASVTCSLCYPLWWLSDLRSIPQGWLFCTRLVSLLRRKHRKYYKVATTSTVSSLLPNTGFEGLVVEMLVLSHTSFCFPGTCVATLQQDCCILGSFLSLTWPVELAPEAVVWGSSSELLDAAGMKPKLEMLRRLPSSLVDSQEGMKIKEKDLLLLAFILKTGFWLRKEREASEENLERDTSMFLYQQELISRVMSILLCSSRCRVNSGPH